MATTITKTIGGITYTINDHSAGGLTTEQVVNIIENLNTTEAFDDHINSGLNGTGDPEDKNVNIHIDSPNVTQTSANINVKDVHGNIIEVIDVNLS